MTIKKVLVVDDSPTERYFLTELLTRNGFHVSAAENADEALIKVRAVEPDLILMDVVMPGQNGFQLTRQISRDPATQHIRSSCAPARTSRPTASGACARAPVTTSPSRSRPRNCWARLPR